MAKINFKQGLSIVTLTSLITAGAGIAEGQEVTPEVVLETFKKPQNGHVQMYEGPTVNEREAEINKIFEQVREYHASKLSSEAEVKSDATLAEEVAAKLVEAGIFVNEEDILAYQLLLRIEENYKYAKKNGQLPEEYADLDLEDYDWTSILESAKRFGDIFTNQIFNFKQEPVKPTDLMDKNSAKAGHIEMLDKGYDCVRAIAQRASECWFSGNELAKDDEANKKMQEFMKLTIDARNFLDAGEYDMAWSRYYMAIVTIMKFDKSFRDQYLQIMIDLCAATGVDFVISVDENGEILDFKVAYQATAVMFSKLGGILVIPAEQEMCI